MTYDKQAYVLAAVDRLHARGGWTGKTHVQKTLALASLVADLPFAFILYKHGPYSYEVDEEIEQMEGYGALDIARPSPVYDSSQGMDDASWKRGRVQTDV